MGKLLEYIQCHSQYPRGPLDIPKHKAGLMLLYGFTVSMAALRLGMLQHFEAQAIIHHLKPRIIESLIIIL